jgi:hypothetical protein
MTLHLIFPLHFEQRNSYNPVCVAMPMDEATIHKMMELVYEAQSLKLKVDDLLSFTKVERNCFLLNEVPETDPNTLLLYEEQGQEFPVDLPSDIKKHLRCFVKTVANINGIKFEVYSGKSEEDGATPYYSIQEMRIWLDYVKKQEAKEKPLTLADLGEKTKSLIEDAILAGLSPEDINNTIRRFTGKAGD